MRGEDVSQAPQKAACLHLREGRDKNPAFIALSYNYGFS